jgi:hypothetical protein
MGPIARQSGSDSPNESPTALSRGANIMFKKLVFSLGFVLLTPPAFALAQPTLEYHVYTYLQDNGGPSVSALSIVTTQGGQYFTVGSGVSPWFITQWGNPVDLANHGAPSDASCSATPLMSRANGSSHICLLPGPSGLFTVELAHNGNDLQCASATESDPSASGKEFDMFISEDPFNKGISSYANSPPIDKFTSLSYSFTLSMTYAVIGTRCSIAGNNPYFDQADPMAALVLYDPSTNQTLFYQILLSENTSAVYDQCGTSPSWYFAPQPNNPTIYGVNEYVTSYGVSCGKRSDGVRTYALDPLPHLQNLIKNSPIGMDKNSSHWTIRGTYIGTIGYGDFSIVSLWSKVSLTGALK